MPGNGNGNGHDGSFSNLRGFAGAPAHDGGGSPMSSSFRAPGNGRISNGSDDSPGFGRPSHSDASRLSGVQPKPRAGRRGSVGALFGGMGGGGKSHQEHHNPYRLPPELTAEELYEKERQRVIYMREALGNRIEWEARAVAFLAAGNARMADGTMITAWLSLQDELERAHRDGTPLSDPARKYRTRWYIEGTREPAPHQLLVQGEIHRGH